MKLNIMSPISSETLNVNWLEVNTPEGNFIIQKGHAPIIATLSPDKDITFSLKSDNSEKKIRISGGILHVQRQEITILVI